MNDLEQIKEEMCDKYCKWPEKYNGTEEVKAWSADEVIMTVIQPIPLSESDICKNCPLNRL